MCLSSLSLFLSATFRFWLSHQKLNSICFWLVTSVGENEEKENTIKPPFVCFSHLQLEVWVSVLHRSWRIRAFIWRNSCKHCNQHLLHSGWPWWRCTSSSRVDVALSEDEKGWTTINIGVLSLSPYPFYFLILLLINWIIDRLIVSVDLSCFSLKINLIHWVRFYTKLLRSIDCKV